MSRANNAKKHSRRRRGEPHVRLYRYELECAAYRSLSTDARALLIEFRALYDGRRNRIHMSIREAMRRLDVGQRRAQRAIWELVERGFIRVVEPGGFQRKVRHATVYALTSEPLEDRDGAVAPKDYMKWHQKSTVANSATDGSHFDDREGSSAAPKPVHGSQFSYRERPISRNHGSEFSYTDKLPRGVKAIGGD